MKRAKTILMISALLLTFMLTKTINVMQDTQEVWVNVNGFGGKYQISNHGRVKRIFKTIPPKLRKGYIWTGYHKINLHKDGNNYFYIHRLVAEHFIPNPSSKKEVNHKDLNKDNNHVSNLEWVTPSENSLHARKNGRGNSFGRGENCVGAKLTNEQVIEIRQLYKPNVIGLTKMIAEKMGVSMSTVQRIVNRQRWTHI